MKVVTMASFSRSSISSVRVIFLLVALQIVSATTRAEVEVDAAVPIGNDPLFPICKTVANRYFDINFCIEALSSDNTSSYADDYQKFTIISVELLTANATSTAARIGALLGKGGDGGEGPMKWCLQSCQVLYGSIIQLQPRCLDLARDFRYDEAKSCLEKAAKATEQCEAEFVRSHVKSPLTVEGDWAFKLARLASALLDHADDD